MKEGRFQLQSIFSLVSLFQTTCLQQVFSTLVGGSFLSLCFSLLSTVALRVYPGESDRFDALTAGVFGWWRLGRGAEAPLCSRRSCRLCWPLVAYVSRASHLIGQFWDDPISTFFDVALSWQVVLRVEELWVGISDYKPVVSSLAPGKSEL